MHFLQPVINPRSLVLPQVTHSRAGKDAKISQRPGDNCSWWHPGIVAPNTCSDFGPFTLDTAKSLAWVRVWGGCTLTWGGGKSQNMLPDKPGGLLTPGAALLSFLVGHRAPRMQFR